jgi:hypothetical protein
VLRTVVVNWPDAFVLPELLENELPTPVADNETL